jgi:uncharacterized membrane protein HdeD (DUF308 family)
MQKFKNNQHAHILLIAAVVSTALAITLGIVHSQYADPESSTPAPYLGILAFILGIFSLISYHRVKKQNQQTNKWAYRIAGLIILTIVIYTIIMVILFIGCASTEGCQLFTF